MVRNYAEVYSPIINGRSAAAGEAWVSAFAHDSEEVINQAYYNGTKESERPTLRQLLNDAGLYNQKLTLDALHLNPLIINALAAKRGCMWWALKRIRPHGRPRHLYHYCLCKCLVNKAEYERSDEAQGGHGRIDQRHYSSLPVNPLALAVRWKHAGINRLIRVNRIRQGLDGSQRSEEAGLSCKTICWVRNRIKVGNLSAKVSS